MIFGIDILDCSKLTISERGLGSDPISEKKMRKGGTLHFWSRTPTFGFIESLVELSVLISKNKKLFRSDELRESWKLFRFKH